MDTPTERTESVPEPLLADGGSDGADAGNAAREARREHMRTIARKPRGPRRNPDLGGPAWRKRMDAEVENMERHPLLLKRRREIEAELRAQKVPDVPRALVDIAARCKVKLDYCDAAIFSMESGVVHRRQRALHRMTEQSLELSAAWLSARARVGLDKQQILNPTTPSEAMRAAFAQLAEAEDGRAVGSEQLRQARERAGAHYIEERKRHEAEMHEFAQRAVREAFEKAGVPMPVEPAALLTGPVPSPPVESIDEPFPIDKRGIELLSAEMQGVADAMDREMAEADAQRAKEAEPAPVAALELLPDPEPERNVPETSPQRPAVVEDMGNPRAMAPFLREIDQPSREDSGITISTEPRPQILRNTRIAPGIWTDDSGFPMPNPFDYR